MECLQRTAVLVVVLACATLAPQTAAQASSAFGAQSVLQYHKTAAKDGYYVDASLQGLNPARTEQLLGIATPLQGQSYAQVLYVDRGSLTDDLIIAATQENLVTAASAATGEVVWQKKLADPVPSGALPCGNLSPFVGITSTPVIDPASGALVVSAKTSNDSGTTQQYQFFAMHMANGTSLPGFPVDVGAALAEKGTVFNAPAQLQRGGLLLLDGVAYAGYGGNSGDCQEYRGRVVGVDITMPSTVYSFNTTANKGAIWAPGGPSSDGTSIFVGTGNTEGATEFSEGNAVLRLPPDLMYDGSESEFFAPSNWQHLDDVDLDLGTAGPTVLNLPGSTPEELLFLCGKEGICYLLDRTNLGGFDGSVASATVSSSVIITAPAIFNSSGDTYIVIRGAGSDCPGGVSGDLIGLKLTPGDPPSISTAWCANATAKGNPAIATSATAGGPATVWIVGETDGSVSEFAAGGGTSGNTLNAYNGETGALLYQSPALVGSVARYHTPIEAKGRLYVATTSQLAAFRVGSGNATFVAPPTPAPVAVDSSSSGIDPAPAPAPQAAVQGIAFSWKAVVGAALAGAAACTSLAL
jgi:outer membrane protein assembly factor BamB